MRSFKTNYSHVIAALCLSIFGSQLAGCGSKEPSVTVTPPAAAEGSEGKEGKEGAQGEKGAKGEAGPKGEAGVKGADSRTLNSTDWIHPQTGDIYTVGLPSTSTITCPQPTLDELHGAANRGLSLFIMALAYPSSGNTRLVLSAKNGYLALPSSGQGYQRFDTWGSPAMPVCVWEKASA